KFAETGTGLVIEFSVFRIRNLRIKRRIVEMIVKKGPALWVIGIALTLSLSAWGAGQRRNQQQQQPQQQPQQQQGQGQGIVPQGKSKDEAEAFNALQMEQTPAGRVEKAEAFVAKFPDSEFASYAHTFRVTAYSQLGKNKE